MVVVVYAVRLFCVNEFDVKMLDCHMFAYEMVVLGWIAVWLNVRLMRDARRIIGEVDGIDVLRIFSPGWPKWEEEKKGETGLYWGRWPKQ
jgi:hypothetical protein